MRSAIPFAKVGPEKPFTSHAPDTVGLFGNPGLARVAAAAAAAAAREWTPDGRVKIAVLTLPTGLMACNKVAADPVRLRSEKPSLWWYCAC